MKRFTARIRHSDQTILTMCRVQYDMFCFGRKLAMAALGLVLAVIGVANLGNMAGILFAMVGCWMLASLNYPARMHADRIRDALHGEYPSNQYEFYDGHFVLLAQNRDVINYDRLARLVEDDHYCYLFINREAAYMLEKASLGDELKAFMAFMEKETGREWTKPYRISTFNLQAMLRLLRGDREAGAKKGKGAKWHG